MSKHTPGPWSLEDEGRPWVCTIGNNVSDPSVFGAPPGPDGVFQFGDKLADAHLISAAPEMLEALEFVLDANAEQMPEAFARALKVIQKARGAA